MPEIAYHLIEPERRTTGTVFASPHSGRDYPADFLARTILDASAIRSSEDAFVERLFDAAPRMGAPLLHATAPRAFVDLNRSADELDPALIEGVRANGHNPRLSSGLGVIPRVVSNGRAIYAGKLSRQEADRRIVTCWQPYHAALAAELEAAHARFGQAILIDCHSMPHEAMDQFTQKGARRPDVVLGDRFGASASGAIVDRIEAAFRAAGLMVTRNTPFAGAYVTQRYGRPSRGRHVVQVEIDRALYMDERRIEPNADFEAFRALLTGVIAQIAEIGRPREQRLAAE
ncbi:N-formylglutamate amidohydrolase [Roseovarius spongiae]|uniref:N-formylglutamate amidohydrolase n=1 Tax=Roseovarius spongiae TaxID=2320272 RepID=A0A3A8ARI5_9RHOB|nr:N-formylglutamate amidohydrolase [Roseovarius spongiae]RKF13510.1 N-formylglutamate amidohydrolase [Roseovarius spongiae]